MTPEERKQVGALFRVNDLGEVCAQALYRGQALVSSPSLKIKLNHVDKKGQIGGATNLSFNNNQQDISLISQFMGYGSMQQAHQRLVVLTLS